jgi:four helix bundle protein
MATIKNFEDLEIWHFSRALCQDVFEIINETNLKVDYKLKEQINGSSGSIMDNIAEGFERDGNKEFHNFLSIAKGSCGETRSQLYRVYDRKYIDEEKFKELKDKSLVISQKTSAFMK